MKLAIKTCTLDQYSFVDMLDYVKALGVSALEIGTGNWSGAPHIDFDAMVASQTVRTQWKVGLHARAMELISFNCSTNPLAYPIEVEVTL